MWDEAKILVSCPLILQLDIVKGQAELKMSNWKHAYKYQIQLLLALCYVSYDVFFQMKSVMKSPGFGITGNSVCKTE